MRRRTAGKCLSWQRADIIFLDINLTGIDGIKTARRIREIYPDVPIVFITAYINYALDGYKVRANRFLVKEDLEHTFPECMDDICREISRKTKSMVFRCIMKCPMKEKRNFGHVPYMSLLSLLP